MNIPNSEIETIFDVSYEQFKTMFSLGLKDKTALVDFIKSVISILESNDNIPQRLFSSHGDTRFKNLNMPEQTLMATIFAEKKETAKRLMLYFNSLKGLEHDLSDEEVSKLITEGKEILAELEK